jgi:hypothetical protein
LEEVSGIENDDCRVRDGYEEQIYENYQEVVKGGGAAPRETDLHFMLGLHLHLDGLIFDLLFYSPLLQTSAPLGAIRIIMRGLNVAVE